MTTPFIRTVRSLDSDNPTPQILGVLLAVVLLGAWVAWFLLADVSLYEVSTTASLQAEHETHPVDAAVSGRVTSTALVPGREVRAGEVLVELDAKAQTLELAMEQRRLAALKEMLDALGAQITAAGRGWSASREAETSVIAEARSRHQEAETSAAFLNKQLERVARLQSLGYATLEELDRAKSEADQRRETATATHLAVDRIAAEQRARLADRGAALRDLDGRRVELEAQVDAARSRIERLQQDVDLRRVAAPIDGRLGEISAVQPGSFVRDGQRLTTVVPPGAVKIVSFFPATLAMGRIRTGQRAHLRLTALAWPQYQSVLAQVTRVSAEPTNGAIRAELSVYGDANEVPYLEHGMTGRVDVEVDRVSPAVLLLRKIGLRQYHPANQ